MAEGETIQEMHTRFTAIINEIYSLGEIFSNRKAVRKHLSVVPESWKCKIDVITEAPDLDKLDMDKLIGNLMTYELKKNKKKKLEAKERRRT